MKIIDWNIEEVTGYKPLTTFYTDFSIADAFGLAAIKDTYKRAIKSAKFMGYKEETELYMVLNWKIWEWYQKNDAIARLYDALRREYYSKLAIELDKNEEFTEYFYNTTD